MNKYNNLKYLKKKAGNYNKNNRHNYYKNYQILKTKLLYF